MVATIDLLTRGSSEFRVSSTALTILLFRGEVCGCIQGVTANCSMGDF